MKPARVVALLLVATALLLLVLVDQVDAAAAKKKKKKGSSSSKNKTPPASSGGGKKKTPTSKAHAPPPLRDPANGKFNTAGCGNTCDSCPTKTSCYGKNSCWWFAINETAGVCANDPCTPSPCLNGGTCAKANTYGTTPYTCACTPQYTGATCNSCTAGYGDCNTLKPDGCEIDLRTSAANCGMCSTPCTRGPNVSTVKCASSACAVDTCATGYLDCDKSPTNGCECFPATNVNTRCTNSAGSIITDSTTPGLCSYSCATGWGNCDNSTTNNQGLGNGCETNLQADVSNCGACGNNCAALPNVASASCTNGACVISACNAGYLDCDRISTNGCECVALANILTRCYNGATNTFITDSTPGTCSYVCQTNWGNCNRFTTANQGLADGCETNLLTNLTNCGACGANCANLPSTASSTCTDRACALTCNPGFLDCDKSTANGCECNALPNVNTRCYNSATNTFITDSTPGVCSYVCNAGWGNCNRLTTPNQGLADGCETNMLTNLTNCGACGTSCAALPNVASASCTNGACVITTCAAGYRNCDGNAANGCETNLLTNLTNCGACGTSCASLGPNVASTTCTNGACAITACNSGYRNCDNNAANGCECLKLPNINTACSGTACSYTCVAGYGNCDLTTSPNQGLGDGCETNLLTNATNCGKCGSNCLALPNVASATCSNGVACVITACVAGFLDCDKDPNNGCECLKLPNINTACTGSSCYYDCMAGFGNCDSATGAPNYGLNNGCEVKFATSPNYAAWDAASATCSCKTGYAGAQCLFNEGQLLVDALATWTGPIPDELRQSWVAGTNPCTWSRVWCDEAGKIIVIAVQSSIVAPAALATFAPTTLTLPASWSALTGLSYLIFETLGSSVGTLPPQWSTLTNLDALDAYNSVMSGTLPACWSALNNLGELALSRGLTGRLPEAWSAMTGLTHLLIKQNSLTGSLPPAYSAMAIMSAMILPSGTLTGTIPASYTTWSRLMYLNVTANKLVGPVPAGFRPGAVITL